MIYKYKVSIIIPTYNRANLLQQTLNSIFTQKINKNIFEVIIIDDGSTDETISIIDNFKNKLNIKYLFQKHNGFRVATARNLGILNASGEICIFLDSGVLLASNAIEENIKSHNSSENYALIGYMYGFDEYGEYTHEILDMKIDSLNVDSYISKLEEKNILDLREHFYKELGDDLTRWPAPWVIFWTGYVSIKRDILVSIGLFDESFNSWGGEDIDLGLSLYLNNIKIVLNRNLKSIHLPHDKFKASINKTELKLHSLSKKKYIHNKYNLNSTYLYITNSGLELNKLLLKNRNDHI